MSAKNFLRVFQKQELYKRWFSSNQSWLKNNREDLVKRGLSKYVGFAITEETAKSLGKISEFNNLVSKFKQEAKKRGPYVVEDGENPTTIVFPRVSFETGIASVLDKYFGKGTAKTATEMSFVKGHVVGIATGGLLGIKESLQNSKVASSISKEEIDGALKFIDIIIDHLHKEDLASSSFKSLTKSPVLARYNKSSRHFLVELQLKSINDESAKLVRAISGNTKNAQTGIRGVLTPGGAAPKALQGLLLKLAEQGVDKDSLVNLESSPSLKNLIRDELIEELKGKKSTKKQYQDSFNIGSITTQVVKNKEEYRKSLQKEKKKLEKVKANLKKLRIHTGQFVSLTNIQNLLNQNLHDQIQKNMGKGTARSVLNYRTGRFAHSAKVVSARMSRDGSIEAFYTYMKMPYATFEPDGRQGSPVSRDPRKLIEKSMREIATTLVKNRLKAMPV
jgi:hypothetical protein